MRGGRCSPGAQRAAPPVGIGGSVRGAIVGGRGRPGTRRAARPVGIV